MSKKRNQNTLIANSTTFGFHSQTFIYWINWNVNQTAIECFMHKRPVASGWLQADGCILSVLSSLSYVKERCEILPAFSTMLLLGRSCQQIINNDLMKEVQIYFSE